MSKKKKNKTRTIEQIKETAIGHVSKYKGYFYKKNSERKYIIEAGFDQDYKYFEETFDTEAQVKSFIDRTRDKAMKNYVAQSKLNLGAIIVDDVHKLADITIENVKRSFENETSDCENKG